MSVSVTPGGLTPPALVSRAFARRRICDFYDAQTHMHRSGGRDPAVASGTAPATTIPHTFGHGRRTRTKSGGCEPAVGSGNALGQALPQLLGGLPTGVLVNAVAVALPQPPLAYAST